MSTSKMLPVALLGAAVVALSGTAALAQAPAPGNHPAITRPAGHPKGKMNRRRHERHPAIVRAWRALKHAQRALEHGAHDFGGHRAKALELVKQAEAELKAARQYDRK